MRSAVIAGGILCTALLIHPAPNAAAQIWEAGLPGEDLGSIAVHTGIFSPSTTFSDGSAFSSGVAFGAAVFAWPTRHFGARTTVTRTAIDGEHGENFSPVGAQEPVVWLYNAEVALRYPMVGDRFAWSPFLSAGWGGKSYRWSIKSPRRGDSGFGWTVGGGVELRRSDSFPFGLILDVQRFQTSFQGRRSGPVDVPWGATYRYFLGIPGAEDQTDFVLTAGITVNR